MDYKAEAGRLRSSQRSILLKHFKRGDPVAVPIIRHNNPDNRARDIALKPLVDRGLVRFHTDGAIRPYATTLTEAGRMVAAFLIAEYADALAEAAGVEIGPVESLKWREALQKVALETSRPAPRKPRPRPIVKAP